MVERCGSECTVTKTVEKSDTAIAYGSGKLAVFATPAMVALMEGCAVGLLDTLLEPGEDSVGMDIHAQHLKATPVGGIVSCKAVLTKIEGKKLYFDIEVVDDAGTVGTATHIRYLIDPQKFMARL